MKLLQQLAGAPVVRGEEVIGYVDHLAIDEAGVFVVLESGEPEPKEGEEVEVEDLDLFRIVRRAS